MKMRIVWGLIVLMNLGFPFQRAAAQKLRGEAVYLKNGSVVTGKIVQNDPLAGIKISNDCGIWLYSVNEIDSLGVNPYVRYYTAKTKGYYNISSVGLLIGEGNTAGPVLPSFTTINGYKFLPGLTSGIGVGYEYYDWSVLPLFADARYFFSNEGFSPFLLAQGGYSFSLEQNFDNNYYGNQITKTYGGPMFGAGAGIRAGIARHCALLISLSYRFQKLSYDSENYWEPGVERTSVTNYNRIALTVSFLFE